LLFLFHLYIKKEYNIKSKIKIIAQEINIETNEVVTEHIVYEKMTTVPQQINELGFSHKEQINILQQSQEAILQAQERIVSAPRSAILLVAESGYKPGFLLKPPISKK